MAKLIILSTEALKRIGRYLKGRPRLIQVFRWQRVPRKVTIQVDSDHAGCNPTRKSTSGGAVCVGGGVVKSWSKTQNSIALSSGEAEYYAMVKGAVEALGIQAVAADLGWQMHIRLWVDSSAAKSMASRRGLGKVRHLDVRHLWLQEAVRQQKLEVKKILGTQNPADVLTKPLSVHDINRLMNLAGSEVMRRGTDS